MTQFKNSVEIMSGMSHLEPKFRGMRRNNMAHVKVEEKRLQKLLDFIDSRMSDQRSKLMKQMEDTQNSAEEMEERKHKATLQMLKNYFEVTSGRVRASPQVNAIHEERLTGVLSEPSLATVPEIDPDILAKPRSMYDRITRGINTSRLPIIAPKNKNIITQSNSLPASMSSSNRSEDSTPRVTPFVTPHGTPRNGSPSELVDDIQQWNEVRKPIKMKAETGYQQERYLVRNIKDYSTHNGTNPRGRHRNGFNRKQTQLEDETGEGVGNDAHVSGVAKPMSKLSLYMDSDKPTPRLGDIVASKNGLTRHSSLKRPMSRSDMSRSTVSLAELQPTRKQQAAHRLKNALKTVRVPR